MAGSTDTIFLKGCPLNVNGAVIRKDQSFAPELKFIREDCDNCGRCVQLCPEHAISFDGSEIEIDRKNVMSVVNVRISVIGERWNLLGHIIQWMKWLIT